MFQYTFLNPELNLMIDIIIPSFKIVMEKLDACHKIPVTHKYIHNMQYSVHFGETLLIHFEFRLYWVSYVNCIQGQKDGEDIGKFFQKH